MNKAKWQLVGTGLVGFAIGFLLFWGLQQIKSFNPVKWIKSRPVGTMYLGKMVESYAFWDNGSQGKWKTYTDNRGRQFVSFCSQYNWQTNVYSVLDKINKEIREKESELHSKNSFLFSESDLKSELEKLKKEKLYFKKLLKKGNNNYVVDVCPVFVLLKDRKQSKGYRISRFDIFLTVAKGVTDNFVHHFLSTTKQSYATTLLQNIHDNNPLFTEKDLLEIFKTKNK